MPSRGNAGFFRSSAGDPGPSHASTREPQKEEKSTSPIDNEVTSASFHENPYIYHLWANRHPAFRYGIQEEKDFGRYAVAYRKPQSLTKIAKTFMLGLDPYFSKEYFEPFERRPRPVTLIGIRKNGLFPRDNVNISSSRSSEAAELQSPYNDVSSFWNDGFN